MGAYKKKNKEMKKEKETPEMKEQTNEEVNPEKEAVLDGDEKQDEASNGTDEPMDELAGLKKQVEELNDKFLRTMAEFDNYRKRTMRERVELIQTASSDMIQILLPVLDDFDRAVKAFEDSSDVNALREGIVLVQQKMKNILQQKGLEEMVSIGEVFDTDLHEAVANMPAGSEKEKNIVMDEVQRGYLLNGKVLRFAKVVVAN